MLHITQIEMLAPFIEVDNQKYAVMIEIYNAAVEKNSWYGVC